MRNIKSYKEYRKNSTISEVFPVTNYFKCKWIKLSKQKTEISRMERNTLSNCTTSIRASVKLQRHIRVETERMEKDIPHE